MRALLIAAALVVSASAAQAQFLNYRYTEQEKEQRRCGPLGCLKSIEGLPGAVQGELMRKAYEDYAHQMRVEKWEERFRDLVAEENRKRQLRMNPPSLSDKDI